MFSFFSPSIEQQRLNQLKKLPEGPVRDYLETPFPNLKESIYSTPIVSLDFETTGLDPKKDHLLSVGYVEMLNEEIRLSTAVHRLVQTKQDLPEESVVIHGITDDIMAEGSKVKTIVEEMLLAFKGKVILAHHAAIERNFLTQACLNLYGHAPVLPMIDTLELARQWFDRRQLHFGPNELRLFALRERHHLPRYQAHNALVDALATAELLLAIIEYMGNAHKIPLKRLMNKR
jgi:DNA polymerase-3 subunit epsilon